jgi:hypothetical protein
MSYKFSKGATVQGDIKAADDAQRDTLIDFGEDQIDFQTSGSTRLKVDNSGIVVSGSIEITQSSDQEMLRFSKADAETSEMVFEMGGNDKFSMFLNSFENMVFATVNSSDDFLLKLAGVTAIYAQGSPKELRLWDSYNDNYNVAVNSSLEVNGATELNSSQKVNATVVSSFPYTVSDNDYVILVEGTGTPRGIDLPAKANHTGRVLIIKDASGNASTNNIQINPNGSENIDGLGDKLINGNKSSLTIVCGTDQWYILSNYPG